MASYSSTTYTGQLAGRLMTAAPGLRSAIYQARFQVAVDTALAAADILNFGYLPKDAVIEDMQLVSDDLDSNGSPTISFNVGDSVSATRYMSAVIGARTGVRDNMLQSAMGIQLTDRTLIFGTVQAAGATKVAGNVTLVVYYKLPGNPVS